MTVGETLTEARSQAGLSVDELSERTRIRGTVIRSIEENDFEACGGDLYVRGYVRAIAGAVGIDAQPLIREYDLGRSGGRSERANGSTGRHALGYPGVASLDLAQTSFDLPLVPQTLVPQAPVPQAQVPATLVEETRVQETPVPEPSIPESPAQEAPPAPVDLDATRYDMPAVAADPAVTSYDMPRVPGYVRQTAAFPRAEVPVTEVPVTEVSVTEDPAAEFAAQASPVPAPIPPAAVPPGTADTRCDIPVVPADIALAVPDFAGEGFAPWAPEAPSDANSGTQIFQTVGFDEAPPEATTAVSAAPAGKKPRGLLIAGVAIVVIAAAGLGIHLATGSGNTAAKTAAAAPSGNASAAGAKASASTAAQTRASAAAQASASSAAKASASASAKAAANAPAPAKPVTSLSVASAMAFGPNGLADGDDAAGAGNAIAADPPQPWSTQWYATASFGSLKDGTGLLLDLGGTDTVTSVRLGLSQYQGTNLKLLVGNGGALSDLQVAASANDVGGTINLTLQHPVAARYLLIWITQLPPNGAGMYQETLSHVAVTGRR